METPAAGEPASTPRTVPQASKTEAPAPRKDLRDPELYINRETSLLEFHRRVLAQARDPSVPLLERLRFLTISSTNLDEFFEVRVAGLKERIAFGATRLRPDGLTPQETFDRVGRLAHRLVSSQYKVLNDELLPALAAEGIRIPRRKDWGKRVERWAARLFDTEIKPLLTPIGLDPSHPFPMVLNKGLCFLVTLEGEDAYGRGSGIAVVQVPRSLPRVIDVPRKLADSTHEFVLLSSVIHNFVGKLFPGMSVTGCHQFRITRNSDLWVDYEEVDNLLQALQGELPSRRYSQAVRLEISDTMPEEHARFLLEMEQLGPGDLYRVNGPVNLHRIAAVHDVVDRPDLKYPPHYPGTQKRFKQGLSPFEVLTKSNVLLHHPYESFTPVVELVRAASIDPQVVAIKQTVYRTDAGSPIVEALLDAARRGKEVTVVVELRARFDEEANIAVARRLQEVGANVVYGVVGYKAHAKMLLIVRREGDRLRRYVHLGTGNYHAQTARFYTDFGFMSANVQIGADVQAVFDQLTGLGRQPKLKQLLQSPFSLQKTIVRHIRAEAAAAKSGHKARIQARMNSLSEPSVIRELYKASQAGVQVDLIVRGICCLRPGVPGVSENIRVRSIVGRFLEHSRIFHFLAGGEGLGYISSADWMSRNLFRRVETAAPIPDARLRSRLVGEGLQSCLKDNMQAWMLQSDGTYRRAKPGKSTPYCSQEALMERHAD